MSLPLTFGHHFEELLGGRALSEDPADALGLRAVDTPLSEIVAGSFEESPVCFGLKDCAFESGSVCHASIIASLNFSTSEKIRYMRYN